MTAITSAVSISTLPYPLPLVGSFTKWPPSILINYEHLFAQSIESLAQAGLCDTLREMDRREYVAIRDEESRMTIARHLNKKEALLFAGVGVGYALLFSLSISTIAAIAMGCFLGLFSCAAYIANNIDCVAARITPNRESRLSVKIRELSERILQLSSAGSTSPEIGQLQTAKDFFQARLRDYINSITPHHGSSSIASTTVTSTNTR